MFITDQNASSKGRLNTTMKFKGQGKLTSVGLNINKILQTAVGGGGVPSTQKTSLYPCLPPHPNTHPHNKSKSLSQFLEKSFTSVISQGRTCHDWEWLMCDEEWELMLICTINCMTNSMSVHLHMRIHSISIFNTYSIGRNIHDLKTSELWICF